MNAQAHQTRQPHQHTKARWHQCEQKQPGQLGQRRYCQQRDRDGDQCV